MILANRASAYETMRVMLNALLILNGGGVAAIPALMSLSTVHLSLENVRISAEIFFLGLILALVAGAATIWNAMKIAERLECELEATLAENNEMQKSKLTFIPSDNLTKLKSIASGSGIHSIPVTVYVGWVAGICSGISFMCGGIFLGGKFNPICDAIGKYCISGGG